MIPLCYNHFMVIAIVRLHGSIGVFYSQKFPISNLADWKNEWFATYSEKYELHHFVSVHENVAA